MRFSVSTMRRIDGLLGPLVCFALWPLAVLLRRRTPPPTPRRIAILKFFGMGSILLATPLAQQVRELFPQAELWLVTFGGNEAFARQLGTFDETLAIQTAGPGAFLTSMWRAWRRLVAGVDLTIDLEFFSNYSSAFSCLTLAPTRLGFASLKRFRSRLFSGLVSYESRAHIVHRYLHFLRYFGVQPRPPALAAMRVDDGDRAVLRARLGDNWAERAPGAVAVGIATSDMFPHRAWPRDRFVALLRRLRGDMGVEAYLIGGPEFAEQGRSLAAEVGDPGVINLVGELPFGAVFALLREIGAFVSNDSGPLHIASAANAPTVGLYGPETPALYGPLSDVSEAVTADLFCSPCLNVYKDKRQRCRDNVCMQQIDVDQVFAAVRRVCKRRGGAAGAPRVVLDTIVAPVVS